MWPFGRSYQDQVNKDIARGVASEQRDAYTARYGALVGQVAAREYLLGIYHGRQISWGVYQELLDEMGVRV